MCVCVYLCVPLIKIHYLISVICSSFSTNMIAYNKTVNKRTPFFFAVSVHVYKQKGNERGKPLVKCVCVCELKLM